MTTIEFNTNLLRLKPKLQMFAYGLTSDRENVHDLVQDTYLKALTSRDSYVDFTNFKAWVFTIMKNTFINNYRRKEREYRIIDKIQDLNNVDQPSDKGFISPESGFAVKEIESAIDSLSNEFRIPFRMHINGYRYAEIADELKLKIGTVKSRIFLARQKLMESLMEYSG